MIKETVEELVVHNLLKGLSRRVTYRVPLRMWNYALASPDWNTPRIAREVHDEIMYNLDIRSIQRNISLVSR
jgi:hypothetical protein